MHTNEFQEIRRLSQTIAGLRDTLANLRELEIQVAGGIRTIAAQAPPRPAAPAEAQPAGEASRGAHRLYDQAVYAVMRFAECARGRAKPHAGALVLASREILSALRSGDQVLLDLASRSTRIHFLYGHAVNVCILAMNVGLGLRWERERLERLGLLALLHDFGLMAQTATGWDDLDPARQKELEERLHPAHGQGFSLGLQLMAEAIAPERLEAFISGEPSLPPAPGDQGQSARVLALCSRYESMSRARLWRESDSAHAVIKRWLWPRREHFGAAVVRAFLERTSLFPPGSYVTLSGGEIARVGDINLQSLMRPKVEVVVGKDGAWLDSSFWIDLARETHIRIQGPISEREIAAKSPSLLARLDEWRWWEYGDSRRQASC